MKLLRIVHVASHDRIASGGSIQLIRAAIGQHRQGHRLTCVFRRGGLGGRSGHSSLGGLREAGPAVETVWMNGPGRWLGLRRLRRILADADIVHAHRERALAFVLTALGHGPTPFALLAQRGNSNPVRPKVKRIFLDPRLDMIVAVAQTVRDGLVGAGVPGERVRVIYGSVDTGRFHPEVDGSALRDELGVAGGVPLVGVLANLDGKKSHGDFLLAAALVLESRPDARFVAIGGGDVAAHQQRAEALGLGSAVRFVGFREDTPACLAALDVSVNCSTRSEGLTGALRESLAMARPVVCTEVGGNGELVVDGETGVLVAPGDVEALARGILWTIENPEEALERAGRGRRIVEEEMTDGIRLGRLEKLYREILARKA